MESHAAARADAPTRSLDAPRADAARLFGRADVVVSLLLAAALAAAAFVANGGLQLGSATLVEEAHATDLVHEQLIVTGDPAAAIMREAAAKQVQLIILGTHGRRGVTRFLMGSVAERVLREAPCAVLVVPAAPQ